MQCLQKYVFGVLTVVASFVLLIASPGCKKKFYTHGTADSTVRGGGGTNTNDTMVKRLLAPGDSYTICESVPGADRFPNLTIAWLKQCGANMLYPAHFIARTGWTTAGLLNGIATANPQPVGPFDLISLLIGVNNQ